MAAEINKDQVIKTLNSILEAELASHDTALPIVDAPDVIGMGDDPARALREKPAASISVAAGLVSEFAEGAFDPVADRLNGLARRAVGAAQGFVHHLVHHAEFEQIAGRQPERLGRLRATGSRRSPPARSPNRPRAPACRCGWRRPRRWRRPTRLRR